MTALEITFQRTQEYQRRIFVEKGQTNAVGHRIAWGVQEKDGRWMEVFRGKPIDY